MTPEEFDAFMAGVGKGTVPVASTKKVVTPSSQAQSGVKVKVSYEGEDADIDSIVNRANELYKTAQTKTVQTAPPVARRHVQPAVQQSSEPKLVDVGIVKDKSALESLTNTGELLSAKAGVLLGSLTQALGNSLKTDPYEKKRMIVEEIAKKNKISQQDIDTKGASAFYPYLKGDSHRIGLVNEYFAEKSGEKKQSSAVKVIAKTGKPIGEKVAPVGKAMVESEVENIKAPLKKVVEGVSNSNPVVKGWTRGNETDDLDMLVGLSAMAGDTKTANELVSLRKEVEEGIPQSEGKLGQVVESISGMMPYMLKRVGAGVVTRGGVAPVVMTGFQGTGDLYGAIKELNDKAPEDQRMTPEEMITAATIGGAAYGAVEKVQMGTVLKGVLGNKAKDIPEAMLSKLFASKFAEGMTKKAAQFGGEVAEETIQEGVQEAMLSTTKEIAGQEINEDDKVSLGRITGDAVKASLESLLTFGILKAGKNGYIFARDKITGKDAQTEEGQTPAEQTSIVTEQDATPADLGAIEKAKEGSFGGKGSMEEYVASKTPNEIAYDAETGVITPEEHAQIMQSTAETSVSPQEAPATESAAPQEVSRDYTAEKAEIQKAITNLESSPVGAPLVAKLKQKLSAIETDEYTSRPLTTQEQAELDTYNKAVALAGDPKMKELAPVDYLKEKMKSEKKQIPTAKVVKEAEYSVVEPVTKLDFEKPKNVELNGVKGIAKLDNGILTFENTDTGDITEVQADEIPNIKIDENLPEMEKVEQKPSIKGYSTIYQPESNSIVIDGDTVLKNVTINKKGVVKYTDDKGLIRTLDDKQRADDVLSQHKLFKMIDMPNVTVTTGDIENARRASEQRANTEAPTVSTKGTDEYLNREISRGASELLRRAEPDDGINLRSVYKNVFGVSAPRNLVGERLARAISENMVTSKGYFDDKEHTTSAGKSAKSVSEEAEPSKSEAKTGKTGRQNQTEQTEPKKGQVNAKENGRSAQERSKEKGAEGREGERVRLRGDEKSGVGAGAGEKAEQKEVKHDSRTGNVTAKKVSADHVEKIVKNVKEQFPVTNVAEVHFVDGLATEGASARITITDGKPVVEIDSRLADSQVSQKVFHELIGHYGLEVMLEKSSPDIKRDIQKIIDHELENDTPLAQMVKDLYAEDEWHHEIFANVVEEIAIKGFNRDGSKNEEFWKKNQGNIFERLYKKLKQWLHRMLGRTGMSQEERDDTVNRIIMHLGSYESPVIVGDAKYFSKMPEDIKEGFATVRMSSSAAKEKGINFAARKKALYDLINSIIPEKEDRQELTDRLIGIKEYDEEFRGIVSVVRNMMKDKTNSIKLGLIKSELEKYKKYSKAGYIMDEDEKATGDAIVSSFSKTVMKPVTKSDGTKSERQVTVVDTEIRNLSKKAKIERRLKNEYLDAKERADLEKELDSIKETFTSEQIDTALKFLTGVNSRMSGRRGKVIREAVAERERTREEALKEIANAIPKKVNFGIGNRSVARVGGNDVFYDIDSQQWRYDKTLDSEEVTRLGLDKLEPSKIKAFKNLEQYELIDGKWHHVNAPVDFEKLTDKEVKLLNSREEKVISGATKEMLFGWTKHLPTRIRTMSWENPKTLMTKLVDNVEASLDKVIENKNITADETIGDTAIKFFKENTVTTRNKVVSELEKAVNGKDRFVRVGSYTIPRDAVQYLYLAMKNKNFADTIEESGFKIDKSLNEIKIPADVINKAIEKAFAGESGKIQKYYLDKVFESYNSDNGLKGRMNKFSEETLGTKIATEPDYFPQSRANDKDQDVTISKDGEMHDLASAYAGNSAPTSRDFMKERIANKHPYIVRGVYDVIHKHNNDTALVMGMYKPYTEAINTLKDVQSELVRKGYGDIVTDAKDMLSKVTGARPGKKSEVESKFIRFMNLGNATKMAKLSVMAKQTLGALPMVPYIKNVEDKIKFLALVAANHPLITKTIGTVAKNKIKAIDNEMVRVSPTLRDRRESMAYALAGERKGGVGEKGVSTLERISQQQLSAMLGSIDWGNIRALYVTIKDRAKKNGLSGEKLDEYMRKEMMQIVNKTQSDSNPIFRTHAQRSDSDIVRGFFMFQSQVQKQWNEVITGVHEFKAGIALKDKKLAKEGASKYIWNMLGVSFLLYFIEMLYDNAKSAMGLSEKKTDDEKVNGIKHLIAETIAGKNPMTRAIVGAGLSGYLKEKFYEVKNPMLQLTNSVLKGINEDMGAIADDTKDYGDKVGFIMGNLIKGLAENSGSATQIEGVKEYIKQITDELKGK